MWISRKLGNIIKHKSSSFLSLKKSNTSASLFQNNSSQSVKHEEENISFILAVISSLPNTGKSALVRCLGLEAVDYGLENTTFMSSHSVNNSRSNNSQNSSHNTFSSCYDDNTANRNEGRFYRLKNNSRFIIQIVECTGLPRDLDIFDGAFICYDTTNRDSLDNIPDMLNSLVSAHVPCLLFGLKSDLSSSRKVDLQLGQLIGNLFGIQCIETDSATFSGAQLLQRSFIQFIYSDRRLLLNKQSLNNSITSSHHTNFSNGIRVTKAVTSTLEPTDTHATLLTTVCHDDQEGSKLKLDASSSSKDTSNDSNLITTSRSVSTSSNLTVHTSHSSLSVKRSNNQEEDVNEIVDRVISCKNLADDNTAIVFMAVFRKFMTPLQLLNILVERFELETKSVKDTEDLTAKLPTIKQERIRSFLCLWLSQYWNDFHGSAIRRVLNQFLDGISKRQQLRSIYDLLIPLSSREPSLEDKDAIWTFDVDKKEEQLQPTRKKDSGYSDLFKEFAQNNNKTCTNAAANMNHNNSKLLKRAASTNSYKQQSFNTQKKYTVKSIVSFYNNSYSNRRNSTPISTLLAQCHEDQRQQQRNPFVKNQQQTDRFGGGVIQFISKNDHDKSSNTIDLLTMYTPNELSGQLTWVEAEIFKRIQPRDFLRHLWIRKKKSSRGNRNPVAASVEHFNFVSGWIASLVVNQRLLQKRIVIFEYVLKLAVELRNLNNFNTLMAVLAGINSAAVLRLRTTKQAVQSKNQKLYYEFTQLETLMSSERSFHSYRSALKQASLPGIPYLGIHQQDLISLSEANKDHTTNGKVHWNKFRLMGECIIEMTRFQYPTYINFQPDPLLLQFIGNESISSEDERYHKSNEVEPRF